MIKKICLILLLFIAPIPSFADSENPITFLSGAELARHQKTIERVQDYLSGLTTIISDFTQVAPDGSLTSGKFFLERPGRMRWQYDPPTPILMVANGSQLVYYDYELEQLSYIPLDSTLIGFLAQDKIRFDNSVGIFSFSENAGTVRIGVAQRSHPDDGRLVLEFSDRPLLIRNMVVTDASGQVTTVSLNNARYGEKIDKNLFDFRDPREPRIK
jgi:outer membrane lipoprotein-sorting protein